MILTLNIQESGNVYLSFLAAMKHKKYYQSFMASLLYASGLRLTEGLKLKGKSIYISFGQITYNTKIITLRYTERIFRYIERFLKILHSQHYTNTLVNLCKSITQPKLYQ